MPEASGSNPFESPESRSAMPPRPPARGRGWRIALLVFLGVVMLPVASFTAGFCCCLGSMAISTAPDGSGMVWGFGIGVVLGGLLVVLGMLLLARAIL